MKAPKPIPARIAARRSSPLPKKCKKQDEAQQHQGSTPKNMGYVETVTPELRIAGSSHKGADGEHRAYRPNQKELQEFTGLKVPDDAPPPARK